MPDFIPITFYNNEALGYFSWFLDFQKVFHGTNGSLIVVSA